MNNLQDNNQDGNRPGGQGPEGGGPNKSRQSLLAFLICHTKTYILWSVEHQLPVWLIILLFMLSGGEEQMFMKQTKVTVSLSV